jgi:hypothetical protein
MLMANFLYIGNEVFLQRAINLAYYEQSLACYNVGEAASRVSFAALLTED